METEARSELVAQNLGFVRKTADEIYEDKVQKSSITLDFNSDDLFQAGCIALWKCTETFDPDRGNTFLTYAGHAMRNAMLDLCREASSRAENKLASNGWEIVSLNEPAKEDEDGRLHRIDLIADPYNRSPEQIVIEAEIREALYASYAELTRREQTYLSYRYGLDEDPPHTLRETARHFHLSANRAERLEKNALRHLKQEFMKR